MAPAKPRGYMKFSNKPVFNEDDMFDRLFWERRALEDSDLPVKALLNYWSDTTGECHCFPVFNTDEPIDIMNRYVDVYPQEYKEVVKEVSDVNDNLLNKNAMSKERLNMAKFRVPIIVWRSMMALRPNFWDEGGTEWFEDNIKKLNIGERNG